MGGTREAICKKVREAKEGVREAGDVNPPVPPPHSKTNINLACGPI